MKFIDEATIEAHSGKGGDGVVAFSHGLGCGMEMSGEPIDLLRRTIAGYARHVNIAATLIIGLGCERNQIANLM